MLVVVLRRDRNTAAAPKADPRVRVEAHPGVVETKVPVGLSHARDVPVVGHVCGVVMLEEAGSLLPVEVPCGVMVELAVVVHAGAREARIVRLGVVVMLLVLVGLVVSTVRLLRMTGVEDGLALSVRHGRPTGNRNAVLLVL